jgi:hypothetical protein
MEHLGPFLSVEGEEDFGVAARSEPVTPDLQVGPKLHKIVNFAIVNDPIPSIRRRHGLPPRGAEIED